jgi:hypothetical protein
MVQTPIAVQLMEQVDRAINAYLRKALLSDVEGFLGRVRHAAAVLLRGHSVADVKSKIVQVMLVDMGMGDDQKMKMAVEKIVDEAAREQEKPKPIKMCSD